MRIILNEIGNSTKNNFICTKRNVDLMLYLHVKTNFIIILRKLHKLKKCRILPKISLQFIYKMLYFV